MTPNDLLNHRTSHRDPSFPSSPPVASPVEHVRSGHIESKRPPTISQIAIRKILKDFELHSDTRGVRATVVESTAKTLAKIDALYDALYCSETLTGKDGNAIETLATALIIEQENIKNAADLSKKDKQAGLKSLKIANAALNELKELASALGRIQPLEDSLQHSFDTISDQIYSPEYAGDALLATPSLATGIHSLKLLYQNATVGIEGSVPRNISRDRYAEAKSGFVSALEEWTEAVLEGISSQRNELTGELRNAKGEERHEIVQLLGSLLRQERAVIRVLLQVAAELKGTQDLHDINKQLAKTAEQLNEEARSLLAQLKKEQIPIDNILPYGSPLWKEMAEKHLSKPEINKGKEWSPLAKRLMYGMFQGAQIYNQATQMNQRILEQTKAEPKTQEVPGWTTKVQSKIATIGSVASLQNIPPGEQNSAAAAQVVQGAKRLERGLVQIDQTLEEIRSTNDKGLGPLIKEVALLKRELLKTSERSPKDTCTLMELAHWMQEVDDQCYAIERMEHQISLLMESAREELSPNDKELEKFGKKHANNIRLQRLVEGLQLEGVKVPDSKGLNSDAVSRFLHAQAPEVFEAWEALGQLYESQKGGTWFLESAEAKQYLDSIVDGIEKAFTKGANGDLLTPDVIEWLSNVEHNQDYLMVRSTGAEDSRKTANAGGNLSRNYVKPTKEAFCKAAGEVVASYFGYSSLQNRINAGENPFAEELKLAVTAQELIGEPIGGKTINPSQIPISLVLFTSEPLYIGEENFRTMRISATYGHGEGVVGAQGISGDTIVLLISDARPDRLYVMYDNKVKPDRLAPVSMEEGIQLNPVPNTETMRTRPVLDEAMLSRLYTLGIVTERFFDDKATDMEIVIKGDTIYPVQARPVNRQPAEPTYIDRKKLAAVEPSPIIDTFRSEVLVSGKSNVIFINNPDELILKPKLEQAEKSYDKDKTKAVVASEPEPANSHPVVNFSGLAVTCLLTDDPEHIAKLAKRASTEATLAIDSQTGDAFLLKGDPKAYVSTGYAVHPMNLALSVTEADVGKPSRPKQATQDVKDLFIAIRSAVTHEAAIESLQALRQHPDIKKARQRIEELEAKLQEHTIVPRKVEKALTALDAIDQKMTELFDETEASLKAASRDARLQPLIRVKPLESIVIGSKSSPGTIGQYSLMDVDFIYNDAMALVDYQKKFEHPVHFSGIYLAGNHAFDPVSTKKWRTFLENLEPQVQSGAVPYQQVKQLHEMIKAFEKTDMLPTWYNFFFKENSIEKILSAFPHSEMTLIDSTLKLASEIQAFEGNIDSFSNPDTFEEAFGRLSQLAVSLSDKQLIDHLKDASLIVKLMIQNTLMGGVDFFDTAIKTMKASNSWKREEQVPLFKRMLEPYFNMLKSWTQILENELNLPDNDQSLAEYISGLSKKFDQFVTDYIDHLNPSSEFNVEASIYSSVNYLSSLLPVTLEDFFTVTHQNLIRTIARLKGKVISNELIQGSAMADEVKNAILVIDAQSKFKSDRTSIDVTDELVVIRYNVPLKFHSARLNLKFSRELNQLTLEVGFFGVDLGRWTAIANYAKFLDDTEILPFCSPVQKNENGVVFEWRMSDIDSLKIALDRFFNMNKMTFYDKSPMLEDIRTNPMKNTYFHRILDDVIKDLESPEQIMREIAEDRFKVAYQIDTELAIRYAEKGVKVQNERIRKDSFDVFSNLVSSGKGVKEALAAVVYGIRDQDNMVKQSAYQVLISLVKQEEGFEVALDTLLKDKENPYTSISELLGQLIQIMIDQESGLKKVLEIAKAKLNDQDVAMRFAGIDIFEMLVNEGKGLDQAVVFATKGLTDADPGMRNKAHQLLIRLIHKGAGIKEAIAIALEGVKDRDSQEKMKQAFQLFSHLILNGVGVKEAISTAVKGVEDSNLPELQRQSFELFSRLVSMRFGFDEALTAAQNGIEDFKSPEARYDALKLFSRLVSQGHEKAFDEALLAAMKGMNDRNTVYQRELSLELFSNLISQGHVKSFEDAAKAAANGVSDQEEVIRKNAILLYGNLVAKGLVIEEAFDAALKSKNDGQWLEQMHASLLLSHLIANEEYRGALIDAAELKAIHPDWTVRSKALVLFELLLDEALEVDIVIAASIRAVNDLDLNVKNQGYALLSKLVERGYGLEAAMDAAVNGVNNRSDSIKLNAFLLIQQLFVKGKKLDDVIAAFAKRGDDQVSVFIEKLMYQDIGITEAEDFVKDKIRVKDRSHLKLAFEILEGFLLDDRSIVKKDFSQLAYNLRNPDDFTQSLIYSLISNVIIDKKEEQNAFLIERLEKSLPYRWQFLLWLQRAMIS